ncbi:hypothetical protein AOQ84DRAFT_214429, partial [Glonium stellatum]
MLILQSAGMGSHQSKPNETLPTPASSRTAQFLQSEGIPLSKDPFDVPQQNGSSIATSPSLTGRGNLPWYFDGSTPPPTQKRRPWRSPSVQGLAGNKSTPSLSPASPPLSDFSTSSEGLTPASSTFSRLSSASSITSPPTSPLSSVNSFTRKPVHNDPPKPDLRPAASSPSLFAAAARAANNPSQTQRRQRPPIPRTHLPHTPEAPPAYTPGPRPPPKRRQPSLDEQWPALQPSNTSNTFNSTSTMNTAPPLLPQQPAALAVPPSPTVSEMLELFSTGAYHMLTQEERDHLLAKILQGVQLQDMQPQENPLLHDLRAYDIDT